MKKLLSVVQVLLMLFAAPVWAAEVDLAWDAPDGTTPTGYKIYYGLTANNLDQVNSDIPADQTTITITNLLDCKTYFFQASAVYADGSESELSSGAYKKTECPPGPKSFHVGE